MTDDLHDLPILEGWLRSPSPFGSTQPWRFGDISRPGDAETSWRGPRAPSNALTAALGDDHPAASRREPISPTETLGFRDPRRAQRLAPTSPSSIPARIGRDRRFSAPAPRVVQSGGRAGRTPPVRPRSRILAECRADPNMKQVTRSPAANTVGRAIRVEKAALVRVSGMTVQLPARLRTVVPHRVGGGAAVRACRSAPWALIWPGAAGPRVGQSPSNWTSKSPAPWVASGDEMIATSW